MNSKTWAYPLICLLLSFSFPNSNDMEEVMREIREYTEQNIKPVMKIQRQKLDSYFNNEEAKIVLRLQIHYSKIRERRENRTKIYAHDPEKLMEEWESIQRESTEIIEQTWEIADKYDKIIQQLFDEVLENQKIWRLDMNRIIDRYNTKLSNNQIRHLKKHGFGEFMEPVGFVLWQTNPDLIRVEEEAGADMGKKN